MLAMARGTWWSRRRSLGGALLVVGLGLGWGCKQQTPTVEPAPAPYCDPGDDCNDLIDSTIRQHSDQEASYAALSEGCPYAPEDVPPLDSLDDGSIPEFNKARNRKSNMNRGEGRLQDIDLHENMMGMQSQIFACVDLAYCYEDGAELEGLGELEFDFEIENNGRVVAVSVSPSPGLDHPSVIACARKTMASHRFPSYNGGQMMINYRMTIEEVPGV